ncbi:hypothetical protein ACL2XG_05265 [Sodalis sp. RH24]|uniref:hypothetical protein n=1 Tax=unclassified Sodalis (in: enterobacteria) TaxID=2636512 RepID=UPI0039B677DB
MTNKYGVFDANGVPTAFYSDDVNIIPSGAIALTDEQWKDLCENQGSRVWDSETSVVTDSVISISESQANQIAMLTTACATAIISGYLSSAMGKEYVYGSQLTDQANLVQTAYSASGGDLWCKNGDDAWEFITHTQEQAQAVLAGFVTFRNKQQQQLVTLTALVKSANSPDDVKNIVWVDAP